MISKIKEYIRNKIFKNKPLLLLIIFAVFWIPVIFFLKIAGDILEKDPIKGDVSILYTIHSFATPVLDNVFLFITNFGNAVTILSISLILLVVFIFKKQRKNFLLLVASVGGASIANLVLKSLFQRDRPNFWNSIITESGYSFPSGHAMMSAALILCLILILWKTRYRYVSIVIGGLLIGLIGLSRVYLGVHYPTDIAAGWCASLIWVFIVFVSVKEYSLLKS